MNSIYLFERQLPDRATPLRTVPNTLCRTKGLYEKKICIIAVSLSNIS
ncbi:MAG: hypothetical protein HXN72_09745 [Prevotella pallens]|nr:hypothetical protein [Prevotella pallens]MBF1481105.1 hypothetical protein [Prevotella pallens]